MPNSDPLIRLRQAREQAGLSQADMAIFFGFKGSNGRNTVADWENYKKIPAIKHRPKFMSYLGSALGLRNDRQRFDEIWHTLEQRWSWPAVSDREWIDHVTGTQVESSTTDVFVAIPIASMASTDIWAWQHYAKDVANWLVKRMAKGAEEIKKAGWEHVDWEFASNTYRQKLQRLYGSMQIFGMTHSVPLTNIFTDIHLLDKPIAWQRHAMEKLRAEGEIDASETNTERRYNGVELVEAQSRLFILGQPGAGKTTFLKYLVMQAIIGKFHAIPIFVSLKVWSDANIDLLAFLVYQFEICGFPDTRPFVEHILEDGKAMILFDGLDAVKVETNARQRITTAILDFAQKYGTSRIVITCRTAATEYFFEQFTYCELASFTKAQIEVFVARWFHDHPAKHKAFLKVFAHEDHRGLRDLARRPLLLTMLCLIFEETMAFPPRRAELYREAIDTLLKKWDGARSFQRDTIYHKLSLGYKRQLLMQLGAETFERGEYFMSKLDLVERTAHFLGQLPPVDITEDIDGEDVLHAIEAQHGLLIERAHDIYSFSHLTFHEYFTACYIAEHSEESVLGRAIAHAVDSQWREVLILTASMLDHGNAETFFRIWRRDLQKLAQDNATLHSLVEFSTIRAHAMVPSNSVIRAMILMLVILDQAIINAGRVSSELDMFTDIFLGHLLAFDLANARSLALTFSPDLASTLSLANSRSLALSQSLNNIRVAANADPLGSALRIAIDHSLPRIQSVSLCLASASVLSRICNHLIHYQSLPLPIVTWTDQKLEESKDWSWALTSLEVLGNYVTSTYRLLECLEFASVNNREAIIDQLLELPNQSD